MIKIKGLFLSLMLILGFVVAARAEAPVDIHVITYNVCGLPDVVTQPRHLGPAVKRFPLIGEALQKFDIIALQEMFIPERHLIEQKLRLFFVARGADSGFPIAPGSGVYIFSRWSIPRFLFERWDDMHSYDSLSLKGFVASRVVIRDDLQVDVYALHAQAGGSERYRISNYDQLLREVKTFSIGTGRPFLILGDFNCELGDAECKHLIENGGLSRAPVKGERVDHIFFNENGSQWKISVVSASFFYAKDPKGRDLSDHDGIEAVLRFEKKQ